jgi:drug/metabolite transporter (DMT)-like permease
VASIRALRRSTPETGAAEPVNAATIFFAFCVGGLVVGIPYLADPWPRAPMAWVFAVSSGVAAMLAQLFMTQAFGSITVIEAAAWQQLPPVASYLWAYLFLGEALSGRGAAGVLLVVSGVTYGARWGSRVSVGPDCPPSRNPL